MQALSSTVVFNILMLQATAFPGSSHYPPPANPYPDPGHPSVTMYWNCDYEGGPYKEVYLRGKCSNLYSTENDAASSFDTHGLCIILWEDHDCHGKSLQLTTQKRTNIEYFNDVTSSISLCKNSPPRPPPEYVIIFKNSVYEGGPPGKDVPFFGPKFCTTLYGEDNDAISSMDTRGFCVALWEHENCQGKSVSLQSYKRTDVPGHFNDIITSISLIGCV